MTALSARQPPPAKMSTFNGIISEFPDIRGSCDVNGKFRLHEVITRLQLRNQD